MKFFNSRIVTSEAKLEDAVKAAKEAKVDEPRSLDELLADLDAQNKGIKTAGSDTPTKTAESQEAQEASTEVKVQVSEELQTKEAGLENIPEDKRAKPFGKKEEETAEEGKKDDEDKEKEEGKCASAKPVVLKMASSIDFREWQAEDVVKAWKQHGSVEACIKNVGNDTDNPKMYCGLLQTASQLASEKLTKQAASEKAKKEAAKKEAAAKDSQKRGAWKVLAKLTDKERSMLDKYWRKLYGDYYVDAMLNDY